MKDAGRRAELLVHPLQEVVPFSRRKTRWERFVEGPGPKLGWLLAAIAAGLIVVALVRRCLQSASDEGPARPHRLETAPPPEIQSAR
jgi:hypothetical protein